MNDKISCSVVRDLLPSYLEGLTEPETSQLIKNHLENCSDCRRRYDSMSEAAEDSSVQLERDVDYMKLIRKNSRWKAVATGAAVFLLFLFAVGVKLCIIGSPTENLVERTRMQEQGSQLVLYIDDCEMYKNYTTLKEKRRDGVVHLSLREVWTPWDAGSADMVSGVDLQNAREVYLQDRLIWKEGVMVTRDIYDILSHRIAHGSDKSGLIELQEPLELYGCIPYHPHTMTLTDQKNILLTFEDTLSEKEKEAVSREAILLLALVEDLEQVTWQGSEGTKETLPLSEANGVVTEMFRQYDSEYGTNWGTGNSVKAFTVNAYSLSQLWTVISGIKFPN